MVKLIVYDFDGVLTDNRVWVNQDGVESVACNRSDGWWIGQIRQLGLEQMVLSTEKNPVVTARANKLKIEVLQGQSNKKEALLAIASSKSISLSEVCYVGNDMNDYECMTAVGLAACPRDSHPEILKTAKLVLDVDGGHGIVRKLYDHLTRRHESKKRQVPAGGPLSICVIPARGGSKGIPKKNLYPFCGKPLVEWSILAALETSLFEKVIVSSDSDEILSKASALGAMALRRPPELSTDTATSESALIHAIDSCGIAGLGEVTFLQPTSPLRTPADILACVRHFRENKLDSLFSSAEIEDWFVWEEKNSELKSVTFDWKSRKRRQDMEKRYLENGSIYVFKPEILMKTGNRLGGRMGTCAMASWKAVEIDSPENIETAEILMQHKLLKEW